MPKTNALIHKIKVRSIIFFLGAQYWAMCANAMGLLSKHKEVLQGLKQFREDMLPPKQAHGTRPKLWA